jgi:hypothetical protein
MLGMSGVKIAWVHVPQNITRGYQIMPAFANSTPPAFWERSIILTINNFFCLLMPSMANENKELLELFLGTRCKKNGTDNSHAHSQRSRA